MKPKNLPLKIATPMKERSREASLRSSSTIHHLPIGGLLYRMAQRITHEKHILKRVNRGHRGSDVISDAKVRKVLKDKEKNIEMLAYKHNLTPRQVKDILSGLIK